MKITTLAVTLFVGASLMSPILAAGPALAEDAPAAGPVEVVLGLWQPPDKLSDYEIRFCDDVSRNVCLKVKDLRGAAIKPKFTAYLGKDIFANAKPAGTGKWKGKLQLFGQEADGVLKVVDADTLQLDACAYVVVCDKVMLTRAPEVEATEE